MVPFEAETKSVRPAWRAAMTEAAARRSAEIASRSG